MPEKDKGDTSKEAPAKGDKKKDGDKKKEEKKAAPPPPPPTPLEMMYRHISDLDKYVETRDGRFLSRVMRYTNFLRLWLPMAELRTAVDTYVPDASRRAVLHALLTQAAAVRKEPEPIVPAATAATAASSSAATATSDGDEAMGKSAKPSGGAAASSSSSGASATPAPAPAPVKPPKPSAASAPEVEAYFTLLALSMLSAGKDWASLARASLAFVDQLATANRRTSDTFSARAYALLDLAHARLDESPSAASASASGASHTDALRPVLLAAHRSATLRHDEYGQAVLIVALLRGYVAHKEFTAAGKLLANVTFPESASNAQLVRYLYYKGRVQAVALDYSDAFASLMQALRKAPTSRAAAPFRLRAQQAAVCVQLLMGEIPDRSIFNGSQVAGDAPAPIPVTASGGAGATVSKASTTAAAALATHAADKAYFAARLQPYFDLTAAVRAGDVAGFSGVLAKHAATLEREGNLTLAQRLEANVIKAGLRAIATSYSRISFAHVAERLGLGSPEDAEFLAAKAIRDGVVDALLDHDAGAMVSRERTNVYSTREPMDAFHRRIAFCLDVHNEAVKGMRYAPGAHRKDLEDAEQRAQREKDEDELAGEIEEGALDEDDE